MPVTLEVDGVRQRLTSRDRVQTVEVVTPERPSEAVLDPETVVSRYGPENNRRPID